MKKFFFLLLFAAFSISHAKEKNSCCSATEKFASLAADKNFAALHPNPLPFKFAAENTSTVSFPTSDGKNGSAYFVNSGKKSNTVLFVFQEWWGLNDYVKQEAARLSNELGVDAFAFDLYDGKVATKQEDAMKYMQSASEERIRNIINGALKHVGDKKIMTVGWCFGGGWSLQTAIMAGKQATACVMYYGMPEDDVNQLKKLQCPVLGLFAKQDQNITPAVVKTFQQNMKKAGKKLTVHMYDAVHAFANPSNPKYDSKATKNANQKAVQFLKKNLPNRKSDAKGETTIDDKPKEKNSKAKKNKSKR